MPHDTARDRLRILGQHKRAMVARRRAERRIIRAFGTVLGTLADLGYDAVWYGLRAADVGAPHGRWRIFICAYPADSQHAQLERVGQLSGLRRRPDARALVRVPLGEDSSLLPTPAVNDMGEGKTVEAWDEWTAKMKAAHGNGNGHGASLAIEAQRLLPTPTVRKPSEWGQYEAAIRRWQAVLGRPAPAPTELSPKGNPRLSPEFSSWLMGLPAGWITDVPGITRNEALKLAGNGVVPQQAEAALRFLLGVAEGSTTPSAPRPVDVPLLGTPMARDGKGVSADEPRLREAARRGKVEGQILMLGGAS